MQHTELIEKVLQSSNFKNRLNSTCLFNKILLEYFFLILFLARKIWKHSGNFEVSYLNRAIYKVYMGPLFLHDLLFPSKRIMYVVGCNINGMVCATIGPISLWNRICIPLWFHEIFSTVNWFHFSYIFGKVKVVTANCSHHLWWKMPKYQILFEAAIEFS